jgi:hypothetical protein
MQTESKTEQLRGLCRATLHQNWREGVRASDGVPFAYTCPSPRHYPWQWYWDSCFTAVAWRRLDAARSRRELESLLAAQRGDGFIGHTIFWNTPLRDLRRFTYNTVAPGAQSTATIQPPLLAWAWRIAIDDPATNPAINAHYDWLAQNRDLDGDGLIWIVQPDESGLDASPQFDPIWGHRTHGRPGFPLLVRRNRHLGFDLRRVAEAGGPVCCEVVTNVLHCLSLLALGRRSTTPQIVERLYDERTGLFVPLAWPKPARNIPVTWSALAPLALPDLPEAIGHRLIEEHLLDPEKFWLPFPPTSVSAAEPTFSTRDGPRGLRRYWRGPTWINAAWLLWLGLTRLGYAEPAHTMVETLSAAVRGAGLREYYHPYTGRGMGAPSFAWSTLMLEMIERDPVAKTSYLSAERELT